MDNRDFIKEYIKGGKDYGAYCHLAYKGNTLWNYSTIICVVDRETKRAAFNCRKYSNTTTRIQSILRGALQKADFTITDFVGDRASFWNAGYQGAEHWTTAEAKDFNELPDVCFADYLKKGE